MRRRDSTASADSTGSTTNSALRPKHARPGSALEQFQACSIVVAIHVCHIEFSYVVEVALWVQSSILSPLGPIIIRGSETGIRPRTAQWLMRNACAGTTRKAQASIWLEPGQNRFNSTGAG